MMSRWTFCLLLLSVGFVMGAKNMLLASNVQQSDAAAKDQPAPKIKDFGKAPKMFRVKFETSVGDFVVEVNRDWSPNGADRFYNLVKNKFYDECRFFRVLDGFMAQVGINGNPVVQALWRDKTIKDDPVVESNKRGYVTFAKSGRPNSRSTQFYINYGDNSRLDRSGFSPFAKVVQGMDRPKRMSESTYFGRDMQVHANIATAMADMHEHLGQLIAYARTNHVVPPWSMGN